MEFLVVNRDFQQPFLVEWSCHYSHVYFVFEQCRYYIFGFHFREACFQVRMSGIVEEVFKEAWYEIGGYGRDYADFQPSGQQVALLCDCLAEGFGCFQDVFCLFDDLFSCFGEAERLGGTVENVDVEFRFEFSEHDGEGRLCYSELFGGAKHVSVFANGKQVFELLECHAVNALVVP